MNDAYLALPLDGVRVIEASAGTGKTFTLATLVLRLVVERGLDLGEVLAVTYTEAATQELRARVRKRLLLAADLAGGEAEHDDSAEATITRTLIDAHLEAGGESRAALRRRLRAAADGIDLAAVFTIHAFCARVLREHALESGQAFDAPELLANDAALREGVAADLWRAQAIDGDSAEAMAALWPGGPDALARDLSTLIREPVLLPTPPGPLPDPMPMLRAAGEAFAKAGRNHGDGFRAALAEAVEAKVLNGNSYRLGWIDELFDALRTWCDAGDPSHPFEHPKLAQLQRDTLLQRTSKGGAGRTPDSPLCDAVQDYAAALGKLAEYREARRIDLLHRVREDARRRLARQKRLLRVQTYDDLVDRVSDALAGPQADALARRLREQYRVALVDEFQDTDPRQWRIFERVFGGGSDDPRLFLIGDPKQAIYGFRGGDVETYLEAATTAEQAPLLARNFRSRPSVLAAVDTLYAQARAALAEAAGDAADADALSPFADARIRFHAIAPGGTREDADFQRDGAPAPALTVWRAPLPEPDDKGKVKPYAATRSRELATAACVAAIHGVLDDARTGKAIIGGRPVQPGDIAVLVRKHHEATRMREALAAVGIPAVAAGRMSLFATEEAREVHVLLLALLHGADPARLRMALSTVLVGESAQRIAALDGDGDALGAWQVAAIGWRERLHRGGPLALLGDLCAAGAPRLLGLLDGERRLTNYLQLAELLQEAQRRTLGLQGLIDWLVRRIAEAAADPEGSADDEAQLLRLESDARRVQVVTLHKSKGLEYPLVFLPYTGIGGKAPDPGRHVVVHGEGGRVLQWKLHAAASGWDEACKQWKAAQRAEEARLLYVGLTRARDALWLASGRFFNHDKSPQWPMVADAGALAALAGGAIRVDDAPTPAALRWLPPEAGAAVGDVRTPRRLLASDWWVHSFTQLANADAGHDPSSAATQPAPGGQDEPDPASGMEGIATPVAGTHDARFSGTRFGVVLHEVLEHADFARWGNWRPGDDAPAEERDGVAQALARAGYPAADLDDGVALLTSLVGQTLTVALPEGTTLAALPESQRRAELEFQFSLASTPVDRLLGVLHAHDLLRDRHGFGARRTLEGLMTGLVDLTYQYDGRWYLLDYKSNRLPGYDRAQLDEAMAHSEYALQALLYTVALHRWLRFRLGEAYDYARDFGGVRYLFCRGLDATRTDSPGIRAWRFAPELVHAIDALFAGPAAEAAA